MVNSDNALKAQNNPAESPIKTTKTTPENTDAELQRLIHYLQSAGYLANMRIDDPRIREMSQRLKQKRYHNTELLLSEYRKYSWALEYYPESIADELELKYSNSDELIEALDIQCAYGTRGLENRLQNYLPIRAYIDRLLEAMTALKLMPDDGEDAYNVIMLKYINPEKISVQEVCKRLDICKNTYSKLRKKAIDVLSYRLWGSTDKELSITMEVAELFFSMDKEKRQNILSQLSKPKSE